MAYWSSLGINLCNRLHKCRSTDIEFEEGKDEAVDAVQRSIDPDMLISHFFRNLFRQCSHLDSSSPINFHLYLLAWFILIKQLTKISIAFFQCTLICSLILFLLLEVLWVLLLTVLLIDWRLVFFFCSVIVASCWFLSVDYHHFIGKRDSTTGNGRGCSFSEILAKNLVEYLWVNLFLHILKFISIFLSFHSDLICPLCVFAHELL